MEETETMQEEQKSQKIIFNILRVIGEHNVMLKQEQAIQHRSATKQIPAMLANGNPEVAAVH